MHGPLNVKFSNFLVLINMVFRKKKLNYFQLCYLMINWKKYFLTETDGHYELSTVMTP